MTSSNSKRMRFDLTDYGFKYHDFDVTYELQKNSYVVTYMSCDTLDAYDFSSVYECVVQWAEDRLNGGYCDE